VQKYFVILKHQWVDYGRGDCRESGCKVPGDGGKAFSNLKNRLKNSKKANIWLFITRFRT